MSLMAEAPLHRRIYAALEGRILSGELQPGDRLPSEQQLCADYACARMTANRALSELAGRGLVIRRRRAGSFVAAPRTHAAVLAIPDLEAEVKARGQVYGYRLLARRVRAPQTGDAMEQALADGGRLLALECLHSADGRPFAHERRCIALAAVPAAETADFTTMAPGAWLLRREPWSGAEHRITAIEADAALTAHLDIARGTACLAVERRTWRTDEAGREVGVTHVWQVFPGGAYDLVARFTPGRAEGRHG